MKKLFLTITTALLFLSSCTKSTQLLQHNIDRVIAKNNSNTTQLTQSTFEQWLTNKKYLLLKSKEQQIQSYFTEDFLYQKRQSVIPDQLERIKFINRASMHSKSITAIKKQIMKQVKIDEVEILNNFETIKKKNKLKKDKVRLYQIYKKYPVDADIHTKKLVQQEMLTLRTKVTDLSSFKKIAATYSDSQTRLNNGLLGNIHHGKFSGEINDLVMKMQSNELSDLILGAQGVLLFYCEKRLPAKIKTDEQILNYVKNTLKNRAFKRAYKNKINVTLAKSNLDINWQKLYQVDSNSLSITSNVIDLTNKQISWLINGTKAKKKIKDFSKQTINKIVNEYIINYSLFNTLTENQKQKLIMSAQYKFKKLVASSVMAKLITKKLTIPTDKEIKLYYDENKNSYLREEYFEISAIAFKLSEDSKLITNNLAHQVLHQLKKGLISFEQASNQYSYLENKYKNGYFGSFPTKQLSNVFGINVSKQLQSMQTGQISKPVESDSGILWIVRLNAIQQPRQMTFTEAEPIAHNELGQERITILEDIFINDIIRDINILTD